MRWTTGLAAVLVLFVTSVHAEEEGKLAEQLESLRPFLGKTWKGEFASSTPEKPVADVMRWERALNGQAVRVLHSVNDGAYGGETIFRWDDKQRKLTYHYFTTAGFMTVGTATFADGRLSTHEVVSGASPGGVTEVRATSELKADGTFHIKTEHLKDGQWEPGREMTYHLAPEAKVVFR